MTTPDPTDEIRAIKHRLAAECGNDVYRIAEQARRHFREGHRGSVTVPGAKSPAHDAPPPERGAARDAA